MRAITRTCVLFLFVSALVVASACGGDVGTLGAEVPTDPATTGVNPDAPGAGAETAAEACEAGTLPRCAADGGVQLCTDGVWQPSLSCADGEACQGGACVAVCDASCEGKMCGDDGCGGCAVDGEGAGRAGSLLGLQGTYRLPFATRPWIRIAEAEEQGKRNVIRLP